MKCRIKSYDIEPFTHKGTLTLELDENCANVINPLADKELELELKPYRKKRTLTMNAYCWKLIGELAAKLRVPRSEVYRKYIKDIGDNYTIVCVQNSALNNLIESWESNGLGWVTDELDSKIPGCTNVALYYGSSTFNYDQFSRLIDMVVDDCTEQGIETLTPRELASLKEEERIRNGKLGSNR